AGSGGGRARPGASRWATSFPPGGAPSSPACPARHQPASTLDPNGGRVACGTRGGRSVRKAMTRRWAQWATLIVTAAGLGLPVLVARRFLDPLDAFQQTLTVLPAPHALAIW